MMFDISHPEIRDAVSRALAEDIGSGDITSELTVPFDRQARGSLLAKQDFVLAGIELLPLIYDLRGGASVELLAHSGNSLQKGRTFATVSGKARTLLECERVALNFLGHLSGIATATAAFVRLVAGTRARVCCTRKTTPGLRALEKYAVRCGGGFNHRFGLDDAILIKDNHIAVAGGIAAVLRRARAAAGHLVKIEIEVDTLDQLREVLECDEADVVLLDNMEPATLRTAVELVAGRLITEASGGITHATAAAIAATGVDYLSSGAITHSAPSLDVGLDIVT